VLSPEEVTRLIEATCGASRSSSTQETRLKTHNYLPTHRAGGSLLTALSKVLRTQSFGLI